MNRKVSKDFKNKYKTFTKQLRRNNELLNITDFGAGSKKLGNKRSIRQIYRNASSGKKYGKLLFSLSAHTQPKKILELGTSLGLGTVRMAEANPNTKITTLEGCSETARIAKKTFAFFNKESQIKLINTQFLEFIRTDKELYDLIFIDGDHKSASLFKQLEELEKNMHSETLVILDDIRWNADMFQAWEQIRIQKRYHLTLDYFRMGVIIQRPHQVKEHFTLRF